MLSAKYRHLISKKKTNQLLRHIKETQYWSLNEIRKYQFKKLKELIEHAYLNVPYYKQVFRNIAARPEDIKSFEDFQHFPVLTKDIIKKNFKDMIAGNVIKTDLIANATGGSTGEPLSFYQDLNYKYWADAARIRGWYNIADCEYGDTCAVIWGAMHEIKEDFSSFERARDLLKTGEIWLNAFNLSEKRKRKFFKLCKIIKPKLLRGYTTAIKDFAMYLEENRLTFPKIRGVILCAETVNDDLQKYVERVFDAPSYNTYGGRELSLIGMQCKCKNGLHEVSENNYVEYEPIKLSQYENAGNLIITNLNNYAMPFLRYRIGDIGVPSPETSCDCGRGLPLISKIIGRTTEVFSFKDGSKIAGEMFIHLMKDFPLNEYQFVQKSETEIILKHKKQDKVDRALKDRICEMYSKYLPDNVNLNFDEVENFEKTITGKFKFVMRDFSS